MKKYTIILLIAVNLMACSSVKKDDKSVTISIQHPAKNGSAIIRANVIDSDIIRIQLFPTKSALENESLSVIKSAANSKVEWKMSEENNNVIIETSELKLVINKTTGKHTFCNVEGDTLLAESVNEYSDFIPVEINGEKLYHIQQVFDSPSDEAFYGLGQHQNGQVNYKGEDVDLLQHNIVAVVPFLVSNKNYGILWDNYSRTKFGDPRDYEPINILTLYDKDGNEGGFTATYFADRDKKEIIVQKQENEIFYKYLEQQSLYPEGFPVSDGLVKWEGFIESDADGLYKFMMYSGGYLKLWVNNELIFDTWRQAWNPWSRKFKLAMKQGEKVPVQIEWIPDAAESYISLEALTPYPTEKQNQLSLYSEAAKSIDYFFIKGKNADDVVSGYRQLTGKSPIMPKWAMGLWQSRERYKTQEELLDVIKAYRKQNIPFDNIVLDWHYWEEDKWGDHGFDYARFPDPVGMIKELHDDLHAHIMISVWAKYYENTYNYNIMKDKGWLYMENINNRQKDWVGSGYISTFYDAFNPDARAEFWRQINDSLFSKGIDAWWLDATEPDILSNSSLEARKKLMEPSIGTSTEYMNAYSLQQTKGVYEGQRNVKPNQRVFILTRSAFAGQQRYAAATWSGDIVSRWSDLKDQIAAGVNMGISGIPYWTTDIGGFALEKRYENPTSQDLKEWRELNLRWYQFGVFSPLFRIHGQYPYREIYNLSPKGHPVYESMVYYDKLRYRLMPYIYSMAGMTYFEDFTIMRPLVMDHASDVNVLGINDEFMFGKTLLVCPVTQYEARERDVYFPATNDWYDLQTGEFFRGGQKITVGAPLNKIPVFVKSGSILPVGPEIQYTDEKLADPITLYVFDGENGEFTLYEDQGANYDYENGMYSMIKFEFNSDSKKLTINELNGQYPGMIKARTFNVVLVGKNNKTGIDTKEDNLKPVIYKGKEIIVEL
ncbi:MAG: DUF5110 domain-containing protein [Bacteroidales bacterium]|nr:DUF5110 domain-containing protein [Bacteroidales bacterium]MBN2820441.1 DUF5110 domain-containing protein [Bacteroidales bacterium]